MRSVCSMVVIPKDTLELTKDAVVMKVSGRKGILNIELRIPEGSRVTLAARDVDVYSDDVHGSSSFGPFLYYDQVSRQSRQVEYGESLIGAAHQTRDSVIPRIYSTQVRIDDSRNGRFEVQFPGIQVNDVAWEVPVIEFVKKVGFVVYPINC